MPALFAAQVGLMWVLFGWWGVRLVALMSPRRTPLAVNPPVTGHPTAPYDPGVGSRDVPWVAWFTNGEGYHNCHHRFPRSAKHALHGGSDLSWTVINALVVLRLAHDPWLPKSFRAEPKRA